MDMRVLAVAGAAVVLVLLASYLSGITDTDNRFDAKEDYSVGDFVVYDVWDNGEKTMNGFLISDYDEETDEYTLEIKRQAFKNDEETGELILYENIWKSTLMKEDIARIVDIKKSYIQDMLDYKIDYYHSTWSSLKSEIDIVEVPEVGEVTCTLYTASFDLPEDGLEETDRYWVSGGGFLVKYGMFMTGEQTIWFESIVNSTTFIEEPLLRYSTYDAQRMAGEGDYITTYFEMDDDVRITSLEVTGYDPETDLYIVDGESVTVHYTEDRGFFALTDTVDGDEVDFISYAKANAESIEQEIKEICDRNGGTDFKFEDVGTINTASICYGVMECHAYEGTFSIEGLGLIKYFYLVAPNDVLLAHFLYLGEDGPVAQWTTVDCSIIYPVGNGYNYL